MNGVGAALRQFVRPADFLDIPNVVVTLAGIRDRRAAFDASVAEFQSTILTVLRKSEQTLALCRRETRQAMPLSNHEIFSSPYRTGGGTTRTCAIGRPRARFIDRYRHETAAGTHRCRLRRIAH
jgi:hypothetical protein